jgi:hypothetical protein
MLKKNYIGPLKQPILIIDPIIRIDWLNTTDTNNELLVSADKPIIIGVGYCY